MQSPAEQLATLRTDAEDQIPKVQLLDGYQYLAVYFLYTMTIVLVVLGRILLDNGRAIRDNRPYIPVSERH